MNNSIYEEKILVFIDILGFSSHIEKTRNDLEHRTLIYNVLIELLNEKYATENFMDSAESDSKKATVFSDSIVISYSFNYGDFYTILADIMYFQIRMISLGVIIRGGISLSELFHDGSIIFGPAMIEAYKLESEIAVFPRIVIMKNIIEKCVKKTYEGCNSLEDEQKYILDFLCQDEQTESLYYLEYISQKESFNGGDDDKRYEIFIESLRRIIITGLENENYKILMKYEWLKKYFNRIANEKGFELIS